MQRHFENLRGKPAHIRKQIALVVSLVVTFFILMFWLSSSPFSMHTTQSATISYDATVSENSANAEASSTTSLDSSSVANVLNAFKAFGSAIKNGFHFGKTTYTAADNDNIVVTPGTQQNVATDMTQSLERNGN